MAGGGKGFDGKIHFQLTQLPEGVIGQSGSEQVKAEEVNGSAPMRTFRNRKRDVLFAIIYNQFVTKNESPVENIEFSFKKVSLSHGAILSKYGIKEKYATKIAFNAFPQSEGVAKVDGLVIRADQVDYNNFIWGAFETDVFRYKLDAIDRILKRKVIAAEAKKVGLRVIDYEKKYIYDKLPEEVSDNDVTAYLEKYNIENVPRNRQSAKNNLFRNRKQRGKDYILEKYIMQLPIKINLQPPHHKLDTKNELTPSLGEGGGVQITLFSGTRKHESVRLLKGLLPALKKYSGVKLFYRPFFSDKDEYQNFTTQIHFCAFVNQSEKFWDFFQATIGDYKNETENLLYSKASELGLGVGGLKECLQKKESKEVVDYHLQYAQYLGITSEPVMYIGGEVLHGAIQVADVEEIIQRKLKIPAAGMW